jgi:fucose permease
MVELTSIFSGVGYLVFSHAAGEVLKRRGYKFTIIMGLACQCRLP